MAEALLVVEEPLIRPAPEDRVRDGAWPSPLTIVGFLFLTFNSAAIAAVSSRRGDFGAVSFVAFAYLDLVLFLYCLRIYRKTPPGSPHREDLKVAMWLLTTMLTIAIFQLLELWFACMGETDEDFQDGPTNPRQHQYPPTIP